MNENANEAVAPHAPRVSSSGYGAGAQGALGAQGAASQRGQESRMVPPMQRSAPRARRMSVSVTKVDAWSVAKITFLLTVAAGIIQIVAATLVWTLLNAVGIFDQVTQIVSSTGLDASGFNLADVFSLSTVVSVITIFSIIEVVLFTLLAAIVTLIYNVISALVGGIHVTLGDD